MHAPLSDPGGVLLHSPKRVGDCLRRLQTVGVPLEPSGYPLTTTIHISGLNHAACILAPSSSVLPLLGVHVGLLLTCWLGFESGGTCTA